MKIPKHLFLLGAVTFPLATTPLFADTSADSVEAASDTSIPVDKARALYSLLENLEGEKSLFAEEVSPKRLIDLLDEKYASQAIEIDDERQEISIANAVTIKIDKKFSLLRFETYATPEESLPESEYIRIANTWVQEKIFSRLCWNEDEFLLEYYLPFSGGIHAENFNAALDYFFSVAYDFMHFLREQEASYASSAFVPPDVEEGARLYALAERYRLGDGVPQDYAKAAEYYKKACELDEPMAFRALGHLYMTGHGVPKDKNTAWLYYGEAKRHEAFPEQDYIADWAEKELAGALPIDRFDKKRSIANDMRLAQKVLQEKGEAYILYAGIYYMKPARFGNANAQLWLGRVYYRYVSFERMAQEDELYLLQAAKWFGRAAAQGNSEAQNHLAYLYKYIPAFLDSQKAFYWYEKAAMQGNSLAQYELADMYKTGTGTKKDLEKAFYWYRKAADGAGLAAPAAARMVSHFYLLGTTVASDEKQVIAYAVKAKEGGAYPEQKAYYEVAERDMAQAIPIGDFIESFLK